MNFPQIRLQSTRAEIAIRTTPAVQTIEQPPADLSIEQPPADMQIERTPPKLTIDQTKARADVDLKSIPQRTVEAAQQGRQDALSGVARRVQEGDAMMRIENGGNPLAELAKQHKLLPEHEFGIGWVPAAGSVKINYDPGKTDINWKVNKPVIDSKLNKPVIQYRPGTVSVNLAQYPSLKIDFTNLKFVGIKYEQTI